MPNSGRSMSAWSCRDAHDYSQLWAAAVGHGDPSLSIAVGDQSAQNADYRMVSYTSLLSYTRRGIERGGFLRWRSYGRS